MQTASSASAVTVTGYSDIAGVATWVSGDKIAFVQGILMRILAALILALAAAGRPAQAHDYWANGVPVPAWVKTLAAGRPMHTCSRSTP